MVETRSWGSTATGGCAWHVHRQLSTPRRMLAVCCCRACSCGRLLQCGSSAAGMCKLLTEGHQLSTGWRLVSAQPQLLRPAKAHERVVECCTQVPNTQYTAHSLEQSPATPSTCQRSPTCAGPPAPAPCTVRPPHTPHNDTLPCLPVPLAAVDMHALTSTPTTQLVMGVRACAHSCACVHACTPHSSAQASAHARSASGAYALSARPPSPACSRSAAHPHAPRCASIPAHARLRCWGGTRTRTCTPQPMPQQRLRAWL